MTELEEQAAAVRRLLEARKESLEMVDELRMNSDWLRRDIKPLEGAVRTLEDLIESRRRLQQRERVQAARGGWPWL